MKYDSSKSLDLLLTLPSRQSFVIFYNLIFIIAKVSNQLTVAFADVTAVSIFLESIFAEHHAFRQWTFLKVKRTINTFHFMIANVVPEMETATPLTTYCCICKRRNHCRLFGIHFCKTFCISVMGILESLEKRYHHTSLESLFSRISDNAITTHCCICRFYIHSYQFGSHTCRTQCTLLVNILKYKFVKTLLSEN